MLFLYGFQREEIFFGRVGRGGRRVLFLDLTSEFHVADICNQTFWGARKYKFRCRKLN